jgi:ABC-type multidrug transport system fused ATPase/permease subunit
MSDLSVSPVRTTRRRAARLVYGLLIRSAPRAMAMHLIVVALLAIAPALTSSATGSVVGRLARGGATSDVLAPALVAAAALLISMVAGTADGLGQFLIAERFTAALEESVMRGVSAIPGLAPFEDPELADRLEITRWSAGGELSSGGGAARLYMDITFGWRYLVGALAAAVVLSGWGWWVPIAVAATAIPVGIVGWRHAGTQWRAEAEATTEYRRSHWFLELGFDASAGKETRLFGLESWIAGRHHRHWLNLSSAILHDIRRETRDEGLVTLVRAAAIVGAVLYAVGQARAGSLGIGSLTAGLLALPILVANALALARMPGQQRRELARLPDVAAVMNLDRLSPARLGAARPHGPVEVRFEDVWFGYPGVAAPVLRGLDLVVPAGTSLALVGENGCGKSTLVKLLCRFYDPDAGRVLLDGVDLREFDLSDLRASIAVLFQEPIHYPFTLETNVAVGCLDRPDVLEEARALAGISELDGAAVLSREFGGTDLSGGEWQRVALARTFAAKLGRDASLLVADEPTAHMDVRIEHDLYQRFAQVTQGQTTILTSHRFSTVRMAERVAVVSDGRVVELGSHDELVAAGGRYAELYEMQARRFRETGALE